MLNRIANPNFDNISVKPYPLILQMYQLELKGYLSSSPKEDFVSSKVSTLFLFELLYVQN